MAAIPVTPDEIKRFFDTHPSLRNRSIPEDVLTDDAKWDTWRKDNAPTLSKEDRKFFQKQQPATQAETTEETEEPHKDNHSGHADEALPAEAVKIGLEDDKRYKNIIKNTVEDWNTSHPDNQITGAVFIDDGQGTKVISQEVLDRIPDIHDRARETLAIGYGPELLHYYDRVEAARVYRDPRSDPAFKALHKTIDEHTDEHTTEARKAGLSQDELTHELSTGRVRIATERYDEFVRKYPQKARSYSRIDPEMRAAIRRYDALQKRLGKEQKTIFKNPVDDPAVKRLTETINERVRVAMHREADVLDQRAQPARNLGLEIPVSTRTVKRDPEIMERIRKDAEHAVYEDFVKNNPKKAKKYAKKHTEIREALERLEEKRRLAQKPLVQRIRERFVEGREKRKERREKRQEARRELWTNRWENIKSFILRDPEKDLRIKKLKQLDPNSKEFKAGLTRFITKNTRTARRYAKKDPRIKEQIAFLKLADSLDLTREQQARKLSQKRGLRYRLVQRLRRDHTLVADGLTISSLRQLAPLEHTKPTAPNRPPQQHITFDTQIQRDRFELRGKLADWRRKQIQRFRSVIASLREERQQGESLLSLPSFPSAPFRSMTSSIGKGLGNLGSQAFSKGLNGLARSLTGGAGQSLGIPTQPVDFVVNQARQTILRVVVMYVLPPVLLILGIIFIVIFFMILFGGSSSEKTVIGLPPQGKLTVSKTQDKDTSTVNGQVTYTITVSATDNIKNTIDVTDTLTGSVEYVSSSPTAQDSDIHKDGQNHLQSVTWHIAPGDGPITLTVKPTSDQYVYDVATASVSNTTSQPGTNNPGGGNQPPSQGQQPDTTTDDFTKLLSGQGRNTGILGDEDHFVTSIFKNASSQRPISDQKTFEPYVRKVYEKAVSAKLNPLILLVIWGVESSYDLTTVDHAYNCPRDGRSDFDTQLSCAVNTLNEFMTQFENIYDGVNPVEYQNPDCNYTDPFIYAYEAYTPECSLSDGNDHARTNFVILFKEFYGSH